MPLEEPIYSYMLEEYIDIGDGTESYEQATNMLSWETESEKSEFSAECIDYRVAKKFVLGNSCTITAQQIAMLNNKLTEWILEHENDLDVPCKIVRVKRWTETEGKCEAKMATFKFNPTEPLKEFNSALKVGGTFVRDDEEWTEGLWDTEAKTFTAV